MRTSGCTITSKAKINVFEIILNEVTLKGPLE